MSETNDNKITMVINKPLQIKVFYLTFANDSKRIRVVGSSNERSSEEPIVWFVWICCFFSHFLFKTNVNEYVCIKYRNLYSRFIHFAMLRSKFKLTLAWNRPQSLAWLWETKYFRWHFINKTSGNQKENVSK